MCSGPDEGRVSSSSPLSSATYGKRNAGPGVMRVELESESCPWRGQQDTADFSFTGCRWASSDAMRMGKVTLPFAGCSIGWAS